MSGSNEGTTTDAAALDAFVGIVVAGLAAAAAVWFLRRGRHASA
jgi:hypothetical protein